MTNFIHLHNHSEHSLLDGMTTPDEMAKIVADNEQGAAGISDHGTMAGVLKYQEAAAKYGINGILGIEAYFVPSIEDDRADEKKERFHLILHAKNDEGLYKLFKVTKKSWQRPNFYKKPRIEFADLEYLVPDVVCLSGCMGSWLSQAILEDEDHIWIAEKFKDLFKDDYYIEVQPWNPVKLNAALVEVSNSLEIPIVATLDCHYPTKSDAGNEEALLMISQMPGLNAAKERYAKEHVDEANALSGIVEKIDCMYPDRFLNFTQTPVYLQATHEVIDSFTAAGFEGDDLYENTAIIGDKCKAAVKTGQNLLPKYSRVLNSGSYLRDLAVFGLEDRGFKGNKEYEDRLKEELDTVIELGFADYFLIVWDICAYAKNNGVPMGPGRGSVGGSLLAYCLNITEIDPIKFDLLFSRFLNKERVSWPDIDMDFGDKYRDQIKAYIIKKWGAENVASIATFSEFKPKGLIKDLTRVLGVPYKEANALSGLFETFDDLKNSKNEKAKRFLRLYPEAMQVAERLEGRVKGTGMHAAGVVVSSKPLWQVVPVESRASEGVTVRTEVTAFDMNQVEEVGLLKFDILGVKLLSVVKDCLAKIKELHGIDVEPESWKLDDPGVYEDISAGYVIGVFQCEAPAYKGLVMDMGISDFNDLAVSNALVRPGAYNTQGSTYVARKNDNEAIVYVHEVLEPVLKETYGTVVYQEQLMRVSETLCGFTQYEADGLRKIIGKKRDVAEFMPYHDKFIAGAEKFVSKKVAEKLWSDLERTSEYMFNKSHAVGYSMLSYQTAWLKRHYPTEFVWALLANETDISNIATYLIEANRLGVSVEGPDVNTSGEHFTLDGNTIRFGLSNVKNAGPAAIKEILAKRPFLSIEEMQNKCRKTAVKSNLYDNLKKLQAFKSMGVDTGYDDKKYWLELLNCPIYADDKYLSDIIEQIGSFDGKTEDLHVIRALVKSVKRKPNYFRVEFEDVSGSESYFGALEMDVKKRDYMIALVGNNGLHGYIPATTAEDNRDNTFVKFLEQLETPFIIPKEFSESGIGGLEESTSLVRIISRREIKTKAGKYMAQVWVHDPVNKHYRKCVVFPQAYGPHTDKFVPFSWLIIKQSPTKDGGTSIDNAITIEKFCELKDISVEGLTELN